MLGIVLRALGRALPIPDPLAVSAFFLRPTLPGRVEIDTEVARGGRRIATGSARVLQDGKEMVRVIASDWLARGAIPGLTLTERVEYRVGALPGWATGQPAGRPATGWLAGRSTTRFVIGGLHEEDFEIWDSTRALVAQSRELAPLP